MEKLKSLALKYGVSFMMIIVASWMYIYHFNLIQFEKNEKYGNRNDVRTYYLLKDYDGSIENFLDAVIGCVETSTSDISKNTSSPVSATTSSYILARCGLGDSKVLFDSDSDFEKAVKIRENEIKNAGG